MGGTVSVSSVVGEGTEFVVRLRLQTVTQAVALAMNRDDKLILKKEKEVCVWRLALVLLCMGQMWVKRRCLLLYVQSRRRARVAKVLVYGHRYNRWCRE